MQQSFPASCSQQNPTPLKHPLPSSSSFFSFFCCRAFEMFKVIANTYSLRQIVEDRPSYSVKWGTLCVCCSHIQTQAQTWLDCGNYFTQSVLLGWKLLKYWLGLAIQRTDCSIYLISQPLENNQPTCQPWWMSKCNRTLTSTVPPGSLWGPAITVYTACQTVVQCYTLGLTP